MAAATIFDVEHRCGTCSTFHPDNLDGRVIPFLGVVEGGESISGVIFWILGQCQGQTRVQMSNLAAKYSLFLCHLRSATSERNRLPASVM